MAVAPFERRRQTRASNPSRGKTVASASDRIFPVSQFRFYCGGSRRSDNRDAVLGASRGRVRVGA